MMSLLGGAGKSSKVRRRRKREDCRTVPSRRARRGPIPPDVHQNQGRVPAAEDQRGEALSPAEPFGKSGVLDVEVVNGG